ncbi:Multiple RNA-binding domain-containing protein 1 [Elasticomyces elasticus]|nr:Multiple RNA-binding domain-containing protein 1 [Elasticomyces elasticus]
MASSRIFIRGLPPTFTDSEFRKHFGSKQPVTDAKFFPQRRIGYVGYKTPEDAASAVRYFNRTFIRMSKIAVEIARPIHESVPEAAAIKQAPTRPLERELSRADTTPQAPGSLKRKRGSLGDAKDDPKLQEFLQVMQAPSKVRGLRTPASGTNSAPLGPSNQQGRSAAAESSDSEYDAVPKKTKPSTQRTEKETIDTNLNTTSKNSVSAIPTPPEEPSALKADEDTIMDDSNLAAAVSDNDWLRSRTSRLLGLVDDEEDDETVLRDNQNRSLSPESGQQELCVRSSPDPVRESEAVLPQGSQEAEAAGYPPVSNKDTETIRDTMRLYIRNLPYGASEDDLRKFLLHPDQLEEARISFPVLMPT